MRRTWEQDQVADLGAAMGFGRLMQLAEQEWRTYLVRSGAPAGGECTVGPCRASLESAGLADATLALIELEAMREALALCLGDESPLPPVAKDVVRGFFVGTTAADAAGREPEERG